MIIILFIRIKKKKHNNFVFIYLFIYLFFIYLFIYLFIYCVINKLKYLNNNLLIYIYYYNNF